MCIAVTITVTHMDRLLGDWGGQGLSSDRQKEEALANELSNELSNVPAVSKTGPGGGPYHVVGRGWLHLEHRCRMSTHHCILSAGCVSELSATGFFSVYQKAKGGGVVGRRATSSRIMAPKVNVV